MSIVGIGTRVAELDFRVSMGLPVVAGWIAQLVFIVFRGDVDLN
jgi:hypothetical protein